MDFHINQTPQTPHQKKKKEGKNKISEYVLCVVVEIVDKHSKLYKQNYHLYPLVKSSWNKPINDLKENIHEFQTNCYITWHWY